MRRGIAVAGSAFFVGLVGLLGVASLHLTAPAAVGAAILIGVIAAAAAGGQHAALGLPSLLLGLVAAYPTALALGVVAFLGDAWQIAAALVLALGTAGFFGCVAVVRVARAVLVRPT